MVVEYEQDYLQELYDKGKCKNKKYRFQPQVVQKYQKRIDTLMSATGIEDLFVFNSLNFEALDNGYYSIRIDYHYRLLFKLREDESVQDKGRQALYRYQEQDKGRKSKIMALH